MSNVRKELPDGHVVASLANGEVRLFGREHVLEVPMYLYDETGGLVGSGVTYLALEEGYRNQLAEELEHWVTKTVRPARR